MYKPKVIEKSTNINIFRTKTYLANDRHSINVDKFLIGLLKLHLILASLVINAQMKRSIIYLTDSLGSLHSILIFQPVCICATFFWTELVFILHALDFDWSLDWVWQFLIQTLCIVSVFARTILVAWILNKYKWKFFERKKTMSWILVFFWVDQHKIAVQCQPADVPKKKIDDYPK